MSSTEVTVTAESSEKVLHALNVAIGALEGEADNLHEAFSPEHEEEAELRYAAKWLESLVDKLNAATTEEPETSYTLAVTGTVHLSFESLEDATMVSLDDRYTREEFVEAVKCGNFETPSTELIKETV